MNRLDDDRLANLVIDGQQRLPAAIVVHRARDAIAAGKGCRDLCVVRSVSRGARPRRCFDERLHAALNIVSKMAIRRHVANRHHETRTRNAASGFTRCL